MKQYIGVDLHSNNILAASIDEQGKRLKHKKIVNNPKLILEFFKEVAERGEIVSIGIESTFNWYWLVDLLEDAGYNVRLGNPAAMEPYAGMKHQNDKSDAYFLAELQRMNCFPDCWICPRELRPLRDLLRARMKLVQKRTDLKNTVCGVSHRYLGYKYTADQLSTMSEDQIELLFYYENKHQLIVRINGDLNVIRSMTETIKVYEKVAKEEIGKWDDYKILTTVPGIGDILGMTILLETGDIKRFKKAGNYSSYCRCVDSEKSSNGKKKGTGNKKNGNKYLAWAFVEATLHCRKCCEPAKKFYQRKLGQRNNSVATKATASKLSKACFYMLKDGVPFDINRIF